MGVNTHLHEELSFNGKLTIETRYGPVIGGKANNGTIVFLEIPYALTPRRFEDPKPFGSSFTYPIGKEYIHESAYGAQPNNDGQAAGTLFQDKVGLGEPTENPLFLNIHIPPSFPSNQNFPVKVYIHGGFLQFGSPHSLSSQAQYVSAERSEIWVNIGYRLSAFGFLASARHGLSGNYGFKDQWLALTWVKANIAAFGGNPDDIQVTGLSAGAHSVHQLLHHVSTLVPGELAPFTSAVLQSNAILTDPKTPTELEPQFEALCKALSLDPHLPNAITSLQAMAWSSITQVIEEERLGKYGTFRGCLSEDWILTSPGPMERQRNGSFSQSLREHGVRYVVVGDLSEEWYLYSIAHPISSPADFAPNLERYFSSAFVKRLLSRYLFVGEADIERRFGEILSLVQVHLPVRVLARDLAVNGFPLLRYEIYWTPEEVRPHGYVTHGTDRVLWALRLSSLTPNQVQLAKTWLDRIDEEIRHLDSPRPLNEVLCLCEDRNIVWRKDAQWEEVTELGNIILLQYGRP